MMKKTLTSLSLSVTVLLFSGCAAQFNKTFNGEMKQHIVNTKKYSDNTVNALKRMQKSGDNSFIDLSVSQTLSSALQKLGAIEHRVYVLQGGQDINLKKMPLYASEQLHINTFQKLKNYIESTTPYTVRIVKNQFLLNAPKVVEVFNKEALKTKLSGTPFVLQGDVNVKNALDLLAKETGFSIVYNDVKPQGLDIYYKGQNVAQFLSYLQDVLNVFIDVDYQNKIITISKYKTKTYNLALPEITEDTTFNVMDNLSAAQKKENKRVSDIVNALNKLIGSNGNIIAHNGTLVVRTTYNKMKEVSEVVNFYNKNYLIGLNIKFEVYKFLLSKNYNFGTDFHLSYNNGQDSLVTNYIDSVIFKNKNISVTSDNKFIRFYQHYSVTSSFINGIPQTVALIQKQNYIKSVTTTTTTGTSTTSSLSTDVEALTQGQILDIIPKVYGNKVFLKTIFETTTLNSMQNVKEGTTTLNLPDISQNLINPTKIFNFGDRKLIGIYQTYENANDFQGIVPVQNFIIGGSENQKYVRELIAVVVTVNKSKN